MMKKQTNRLDARLRLAGVLIIVGLLTQTISLLWNHPLSFVAYLVIGGLLVAIGIVVYLLTLVDLPIGRPEKADDLAAAQERPS